MANVHAVLALALASAALAPRPAPAQVVVQPKEIDDLLANPGNNKSAPLPESARPEIERSLRKLGYRLVLRSLRHPASVAPATKQPALRLAIEGRGEGRVVSARPDRGEVTGVNGHCPRRVP